MTFSICPRCGSQSFEQLRSHSYCVDCNYSESESSDADSVLSTLLELEAQLAKSGSESLPL